MRLSDAPTQPLLEPAPHGPASVYVGPGVPERAHPTFPPPAPDAVAVDVLDEPTEDLPRLSALPLPARSEEPVHRVFAPRAEDAPIPGLSVEVLPEAQLEPLDEGTLDPGGLDPRRLDPYVEPRPDLVVREVLALESIAASLKLLVQDHNKVADRAVAIAQAETEQANSIRGILKDYTNHQIDRAQGSAGQEVCRHLPGILGIKDRRKAEALAGVLAALFTLGLTLFNLWVEFGGAVP